MELLTFRKRHLQGSTRDLAGLPSLYDVIEARPDGWAWGQQEREDLAFRIMAWPDLTPTQARQLLAPIPATWDGRTQLTYAQYRHYAINWMDPSIPTGIRNEWSDNDRTPEKILVRLDPDLVLASTAMIERAPVPVDAPAPTAPTKKTGIPLIGPMLAALGLGMARTDRASRRSFLLGSVAAGLAAGMVGLWPRPARAAIVTQSIGTASRDFSTLGGWSAALPVDIVASGNSYVGECYADSEFISTNTHLILVGHTTDATHTITLTTAAGQSFRDNAAIQSLAHNYNASAGVAITSSLGAGATIYIEDNFVTLSNLQIRSTGTVANEARAIDANIALNMLISNCILVAHYREVIRISGGDAALTSNIKNSTMILHTGNTTGVVVEGMANVYFSALVTPSDMTGPAGSIYLGANSSPMYRNCTLFNAGQVVLSGSVNTPVFMTCATNIASPPSGFASVTYGAQYENTTAAAGDFRVKAGADILSGGTADPTNGAFDIVKTSRPQGGTWGRGSWEFVEAGVAATPGPMPITPFGG